MIDQFHPAFRPGRKTRGILLIPVLLFILLLLNACGEAADTSGLSGSYVLKSVEDEDIKLSEGRVAEIVLGMRLDPGGGGVIISDGSEGILRWTYDQDRLQISAGNIRFNGYLDGTDLILQAEDSPALLRFTPEVMNPADETETSPSDEAEIVPEVWSGDWYGWWKIEQSEGSFPVSWYDCCACFVQQDDGTLLFTIWDEDGSKSEPLGEILFEETADHKLSSLSGYFLYDAVSAGECLLPVSGKDFLLENYRHKADGESFIYTVYLRPWGAKWDDLSEEQLPFYYDDWYLMQIRENRSMPDQIPWKDLEKNRETPSD